jgi:hypothetical protein
MTAQDHPTFHKPKDIDVKIWRFMSLAKFLWMLQNGALYFSRSDLMDDPFEGHYSRVTAMSEESFVAAQMTDPIFAEMGESVHSQRSPDEQQRHPGLLHPAYRCAHAGLLAVPLARRNSRLIFSVASTLSRLLSKCPRRLSSPI